MDCRPAADEWRIKFRPRRKEHAQESESNPEGLFLSYFWLVFHIDKQNGVPGDPRSIGEFR